MINNPCILDKNTTLLLEVDNLDTLKENLLKKIDFGGYTFDNFALYKFNMYILFCSIREDGKNPLYFFIYYDDNKELSAYIPKNNLSGDFNADEVNAYMEDDNISFVLDEFKKTHDIVVAKDSRYSTFSMSMDDFKKYIKSFNYSLNQFCDDVENNNCKFVVEKYSSINGKNYAYGYMKKRGFHKVYGFVFPTVVDEKSQYKDGKLQMYVSPTYNNLYITSDSILLVKEEDKSTYDEAKLLELFDYNVNLSDKQVSITGDIYEINGIPYKVCNLDKTRKISCNTKESCYEGIYDVNEVKKTLCEFDSTIDTNDIIIKEFDTYFQGGWFVYTKCKVKNRHSVYVVSYLDENDHMKHFVPTNYNHIFEGKVASAHYPSYKTKFESIFNHIFSLMERKEDEFIVHDIRQSRSFGEKRLSELIVADNVINDIPSDDFRIKIVSISNVSNVNTYAKKNLAYCVADGIDEKGNMHKIGLYVDIMNRLRAYVTYNKDYVRDICETIMTV